MLRAILALVLLDPAPAARVVAAVRGIPEAAPALIEICWRESRCRRVGLHPLDGWISRVAYPRAVRAGRLRPGCQPPDPVAWASRGAWGLVAAYHVDHLGVPCLPPWILDVPAVSAWIAAGKLRRICRDSDPPRWDRRWVGDLDRRCRWTRHPRRR